LPKRRDRGGVARDPAPPPAHSGHGGPSPRQVAFASDAKGGGTLNVAGLATKEDVDAVNLKVDAMMVLLKQVVASQGSIVDLA
jgi:hypothetical protein